MTRRELFAKLAVTTVVTHPNWDWLTDMLHTVREAEPGEIPPGAAAGLLVRPEGYVAVMQGKHDPAYTASLIAHEAWHARQHAEGRKYYGQTAEREAWALQAVCLASIDPKHRAIPWLLSAISTLEDSEPLRGNPRVE